MLLLDTDPTRRCAFDSTANTLCLGLLAFYADERWTIQDAFHSQWIQCDLEELSTVYLQRVGTGATNQS